MGLDPAHAHGQHDQADQDKRKQDAAGQCTHPRRTCILFHDNMTKSDSQIVDDGQEHEDNDDSGHGGTCVRLKIFASIAERQGGAILPVVLIVLVVALMIRLGFWQLQRAREKENLLHAFAQGQQQVQAVSGSERLDVLPRYQTVQLHGRWKTKPVILLENRFLDQRPGFDVLLLFQPARGPVLLVNQGWVPQPPESLHLPEDETTVVGRVDEYPRPGMVLGEPFAGVPAEAAVWSSPYVDAQSLTQRLGQQAASRVLLANQPVIEDAVPHWKPATMPPERHRGYAFQWFSMAGALAGIGLWLWIRKHSS